MENAYTPPQADLRKDDQSAGQYGSVEKAISGDWDFAIGETISEAWSLIKGTKLSFFAAIVVYAVISTVAMALVMIPIILMTVNNPAETAEPGLFFYFLVILISLLLTPLYVGIMMMGVRRSLSKDISFTQMFNYYPKIVPILGLTFLMLILVFIGYLFFIIPGIYLGIGYSFAMVLMLDKNMGFWEAMETSRKAVTKHWFKILFFYIVIFIIYVLGSIPLYIGTIWTGPFLVIAYGVLYRNIFGVTDSPE